MNVVESIKDKATVLASSVGDFNKLTIDKIEEAAGLNIASVGYLNNILIRQLRIVSGIRDLESIQKLTADSISLSGDLAKRLLDDGKAWLNLGVDFTKKATDLLKGDSVDAAKKSAVKSVAA
jgi:phasin family protein